MLLLFFISVCLPLSLSLCLGVSVSLCLYVSVLLSLFLSLSLYLAGVGASANTTLYKIGQCFGNPTPTTWLKSTAVHLQFVRQYAPHLHRHTFLASKLRRKGNPAVRLPFVLQYASHLYGSTPPICTTVLLENYSLIFLSLLSWISLLSSLQGISLLC